MTARMGSISRTIVVTALAALVNVAVSLTAAIGVAPVPRTSRPSRTRRMAGAMSHGLRPALGNVMS